MYDNMFGTQYENAVGEAVILPPAGGSGVPVTSESALTKVIDHVKQNKVIYYTVIAIAAFVVYKKFFIKK